VALDELAVRVDAAQLQDGVAHRRLHQHGQVAAASTAITALRTGTSRMSSYSGS
jgi:hypothetical protein